MRLKGDEMNPKERILKMLEEGKINADDAAKLLEALKKSFADDLCVDVNTDKHHHKRFEKRIYIPRFAIRHNPFFGHTPRKIVVRMNKPYCGDVGDIEIMPFGDCSVCD